MYQEFEKMSSYSRIWVYQSNRDVSAKEENIIDYFLKEAIVDWAAHGATLLASASVFHKRFVAIALDESKNASSGCSIDASAHWMKELGEKLGIDFFDRSIVYEADGKLKSHPIFSIKKAIGEDIIKSDTPIFNNNIQNLSDLKSNWKIPAKQMPFLKRYFKKELA